MTFIFLSVAIGLLIRAYFLFYSVEYEKKSAEFNKDAAVFARNIRDKFHYNSEVISALQSYFNAAGVPSYEVFKKLADSYQENHKEIRALIWLPHVTESAREDFLHEAQKTFSSFQILDLQKDDSFLPSSPSSEYYPLYYIAPYEKNKIALGFNYLSNDERKKGIEKSRDSGKVTVTRPLKLIFPNETPVGFILMSPVYNQNQPVKTIEEKRKNILGIVAGVFKTSDVLNTLNPQDSEIFSISLSDRDAQRGKRILYSSENKEVIHPSNLWHYQEKINFGNNVWLLQLSPRDGYYTPKLQFLDIATLFIAFILIFITSTFIWFTLKYYEENDNLVTQFKNLLEATNIPTFILDKDQKIVVINRNLNFFFGYTGSQLIRKSCKILFNESAFKKISKIQDRIMKINKEGLKQSIKIRSVANRRDGSTIPVEIEIDSLIKSPRKNLFICKVTDLRKIKKLNKNSDHNNYYDNLTQLPNKEHFAELIRNEVMKSLYSGHPIAVLIINLDQFKEVNKSFDIATGDLLLKSVAERLKREIRSQDIIARMNGDEFALLTTAAQNRAETQSIAQRLLDLFEHPFQLGSKNIKLSASIGISFSLHGSADPISFLNKAEIAMYHAKNKGGNSYAFYDSGIDSAYRKRFELETALNSAVKKNEFYLEYQPIYEVPHERIVGVEALLRWNYPPLGLVSPLEFIPFVEDKPLIKTIGRWVFETACNDYKSWGPQFEGYLSINFTALQLEDKIYMQDLVDFCKKEEIPLKKIVLEVTESTFMQRSKRNKKLMQIIALKGFNLSVDDFGTKYASFGRLASFPPSYLKIDKSFIDGIGRKKNEEEIIISIISLAQK